MITPDHPRGAGGRRPGGQKLGPVLSQRLIENYESLKEAASALDLDYDILRQDFSKNRFSEGDLGKLCMGVGLPVARRQLEKEYDFDVKKAARGAGRAREEWKEAKSLHSAFNLIGKEMGRVRRLVGVAREILPRLLSSLGGHDMLVVFISDEMPSHWSGNAARSLIPSIAEALRHDALIVYLHPSAQLVDVFRGLGWSGLKTPMEVASHYELFKDSLSALVKDDVRLKNLCMIEHDSPLVCMAQHRYALYLHSEEGCQEAWATGTFPIEYVGAQAEASPYCMVIPLNRRFRDVLQDILLRTLLKKLKAEMGTENENDARRFLERVYSLGSAGKEPAEASG